MIFEKILTYFFIGTKAMRFKKIALYILTIGASLTLGFLSLGGMYALLPFATLAIIAMVLSIGYEAEVYLQNIKAALIKLFQFNYLKTQLAREYLQENLLDNLKCPNCPQFFKDYKALLLALDRYTYFDLDEKSARDKKAIEKKLSDMEKWFAIQLFANQKSSFFKLWVNTKLSAIKRYFGFQTNAPVNQPSEYANSLRGWKEWHSRLEERSRKLLLVKGFGVLAGIFMGFATTYLIVDVLMIIPFLATIPFITWPILIPIVIIALGMREYNSITDFINNDTFNKWKNKLSRNWREKGATPGNVLMSVGISLLFALGFALTICTGGTWMTVASNARPLFSWMGSLPALLMNIINPIITIISAGFFNFQNTAETLEMLEGIENPWTKIKKAWHEMIDAIKTNENWYQRINLPRILLKLTILPLRIVLFVGHLLSMAVTTDQVDGWEIVLSIIGFIAEGFEDGYRFFKPVSKNDPNRSDLEKLVCLLEARLKAESDDDDTDIPTLILKAAFSPLYVAAAVWDWGFSQLNTQNSHILSFSDALKKQWGATEKGENVAVKEVPLSREWERNHALFLLDKYKAKHFSYDFSAQEKIKALDTLQQKVSADEHWEVHLRTASINPILNRNRFFIQKDKTATTRFLEDLPQHVFTAAAAC